MLQLSIIGRVGRDAVVRHVNGKNVVNFPIAHNEKYRDQQGIQHERTTWIDCSLWRDNEARVAQYLTKGQQVYVEGSPSTEAYASKETGELRASLKLSVRRLELLGGGPGEASPAKPAENGAAVPADTTEDDGPDWLKD